MTTSPVELPETHDVDPRRADRRRFRQALAGLFASGLLHGSALFVCVLALLGIFDLLWFLAEPLPQVVIVAGVEERVEPIELTLASDSLATAEELVAEHVTSGRDWSFELVDEAMLARDVEAPLPKDAVAAKWVEQASDQSQQRSTDENLDQLDKLGQRLTAVSSEQAIGDIGGVLSKALNLEDRATAPAAPNSEAEPRLFDAASAQLHDVRIERDDASGAERYVATLVDRHGTAVEMEMDPASGKQAYEVMQTIKKYPLLESVYRAVVMKILDRLIEPTPGSPTS